MNAAAGLLSISRCAWPDPSQNQHPASSAASGRFLCLLGYVGVATPLLPLSAAGLACLDGGHSVSLAGGANRVAVVLGHDSAGAVSHRVHTHSPLAAALMLLAATTPGQADHILDFHSGGTALIPEETLSIVGHGVEESPVEFPSFAHIAAGPPADRRFPGTHFPPLPHSARIVQTTVRLI